MLKKLLTLALVAVGVFSLAACGGTTEEGLTDLEKLGEALVEVDLPSEASTDLTFPTTGLHDVEITWESDNTDVIANDGTVTIPTKTMGDQTVTITAFLTIGDNTLTKEFDVTVLAATEYTDAEKVAQAKSALLIAETIVVSDLTLVATALEATVTWSSSNDMYITDAGVVTRPSAETGNVQVTLTATLTVGAASDTKEFVITVQAEEPADMYASISDMYDNALLNDYIEFTGIVTGTFDGGYFLSDGTHALGIYSPASTIDAAIGDEVKVKGFYAVYNTLYQLGNIVSEEVLSSGNTNPLAGTEMVKTVEEVLALDSSVPTIHGMYYTITGTVELRGSYDNVYLVDGDFAVLIYYYSNEDSIAALEAQVGKEVTITVFYYTDHGTNGPMVAYDGGEAGITINTLPDDEALEADIAALESEIPGVTLSSITLPSEGANGTMFSAWTSSDTAVLGDDGAFVALGATTVTVTFTGTATKGALTETVTVDVVVPLNSTVAEVLAMENGDYFQVTGVVYELSYYGFFIENGGEYLFVFDSDLVADVVAGDEVTLLASLGEYSGLKQANPIGGLTVNSQGNAEPAAVVTTVSAIENDLVARGTRATITGTLSREGSYNNVYITDTAGGKVGIYYRSNDEALFTDADAGNIVTITVVTYQDASVLYNLTEAEIVVETGFTDAQKAQDAADNLDLGNIMAVEADLTLPASLGDATITWATSDAAVVTDAGVVTRVAGDTPMATLTATVTVGAEVVTRDFVIYLVDLNDSAPISVSEALLLTDGETPLVTGIITGKYYDERVIQDITTGVGIYVDENIGGEIGDIIVVRGELVTYTSNDNLRREIEYHSYFEIISSGNALVIDAETDPAVIADEFAEMRTYTATLTYASADEFGYLFFNGSVDRQIKFSDFYAPYFTDVYTVGDTLEVTFTVMDIHYGDTRVVNVTLPELTDAQAMTAAVAAVEVPTTASADLELPTEMYGVAISWASSNPAIGVDGVVTRPANGSGDATGNLTATFSIGTETDVVVDFPVTVPEEAAAGAPDLFISEYAEADGGSCKYIEIYNPTDSAIDLTAYEVRKGGNGTPYATTSDIYDLTGTLAAGAVLVLGNSACTDPGDAAQGAGLSNPFPTSGITFEVTTVVGYVNGDDALGLFKDGVLIDTLGLNGVDPGSSWEVGNGNLTDGTTANVILIRIPSVMYGSDDWAVVAQQWIVATDDRDYSSVGNHTTN